MSSFHSNSDACQHFKSNVIEQLTKISSQNQKNQTFSNQQILKSTLKWQKIGVENIIIATNQTFWLKFSLCKQHFKFNCSCSEIIKFVIAIQLILKFILTHLNWIWQDFFKFQSQNRLNSIELHFGGLMKGFKGLWGVCTFDAVWPNTRFSQKFSEAFKNSFSYEYSKTSEKRPFG